MKLPPSTTLSPSLKKKSTKKTAAHNKRAQGRSDWVGLVHFKRAHCTRRKKISACKCLQGCLFSNDNMKDTEGLGAMYKTKYCLSDNSNCARYMVFKKPCKPAVPVNMYPNMYKRTKIILTGKEIEYSRLTIHQSQTLINSSPQMYKIISR